MPFNFGQEDSERAGLPGQARQPAQPSGRGAYQPQSQPAAPSESEETLQLAIGKIDGLLEKAQSKLNKLSASTDLQLDLQDLIDGKGQAFDRTTAKVDDANARMKSVGASGRAGLLGILNAGNATAIQSQVGNQAARQARTDEQAGARALLAQVLASGQDLDAASAREQLNQLQETVVPGDPLAALAPIAATAMTAFDVWSQSKKAKKPSQGVTNGNNKSSTNMGLV